jgi:hypothetical protein
MNPRSEAGLPDPRMHPTGRKGREARCGHSTPRKFSQVALKLISGSLGRQPTLHPTRDIAL